jgi:hypothetical protein
MKQNLSTDQHMKDMLLTQSLIPLVGLLLGSETMPDCEKLKDKLVFFSLISQSTLRDNSNYACFDNLKSMYQQDEIPRNVFWISSVNSKFSGIPIPPDMFLEDLRIMVEKTINNGFDLTHEWYFQEGDNSGVFLHFVTHLEGISDFVSILIAFGNRGNDPALVHLRGLNK